MWTLSVLIYKKKDPWKTNNYRGIALQDVLDKTRANLIHSRLEGNIEKLLGDYRCGFHKSKLMIDQIFFLG